MAYDFSYLAILVNTYNSYNQFCLQDFYLFLILKFFTQGYNSVKLIVLQCALHLKLITKVTHYNLGKTLALFAPPL